MVTGLANVAALLSAARAARDELHRDGHRLTRDALATRMAKTGTRSGTPASRRCSEPTVTRRAPVPLQVDAALGLTSPSNPPMLIEGGPHLEAASGSAGQPLRPWSG